MSERAVIIGRGVIGAATALELARDGWDVVAVDRNGTAGHGSTSASSGVVRTYYSTLAGTSLAWEGYHAWRDFAAHLGHPAGPVATLREVGCLTLLEPGGDRQQAQRSHADALGIPYEIWTADRVRARLPCLELSRYAPVKRPEDAGFGLPTGGSLEGAVHWPRSGYVADPMLAAQNLWDAAAGLGARAMRGEVAAIRWDDRVRAVVLADGTEVAGDVVVNVAGPGSLRINRLAGVTEGMARVSTPMRQEVVHLPSPRGFDFGAEGMILSDGDIGVYCRPERDGLLVGSQEPDCDPMVWVEDERALDRALSDQGEAQAMRQAQRMPDLGLPSRQAGVVEMYDATPDWTPIYDRSSLPGFYMACGTSGNQFKNAPVAGRLMADLIAACEGGHDHDAEPLEVALPRTGGRLGLAAFSRLRPAKGGPNNVLG